MLCIIKFCQFDVVSCTLTKCRQVYYTVIKAFIPKFTTKSLGLGLIQLMIREFSFYFIPQNEFKYLSNIYKKLSFETI